MAYNYQNPYQTPNPYQNYFQQPTPMPTPMQQPQSNSIVWVQGEAGAKSYLVGAGNSVLLMDSEESVFYIKSTDASGMPLPLRIFEYKEKSVTPKANAEQISTDMFVTHEELEKRLQELATPKKTKSKLLEEDKVDG